MKEIKSSPPPPPTTDVTDGKGLVQVFIDLSPSASYLVLLSGNCFPELKTWTSTYLQQELTGCWGKPTEMRKFLFSLLPADPDTRHLSFRPYLTPPRHTS